MKLFGNSSHSDHGAGQHSARPAGKSSAGKGEILPKARNSEDIPIKNPPKPRSSGAAAPSRTAPAARSGKPQPSKKRKVMRGVFIGLGALIYIIISADVFSAPLRQQNSPGEYDSSGFIVAVVVVIGNYVISKFLVFRKK